jgi:RimJ/RimL family protein N-acetyltransferase
MMSTAGKTAPAELETPRLRLRAWTDDDLPAFAAMNADPEVMRYFPEAMSTDKSDRLAKRIRDNTPVPTQVTELRDKVKDLEQENKQLIIRLEKLEAARKPEPTAAAESETQSGG